MSGSDGSLDGKVAVVTGAGRGIGRAIGLAFGAAGASVCCAARTLSEIQEAAREIKSAGGRAMAIQTDVTVPQQVEAMFEATSSEFGGVDIVVINAGESLDRRHVEESVPEDWLATVNVNLVGAYYCARAAIPYLKSRGAGKIITVGSGMGHNGKPGASAYAVSKAGLWMLTRVLAQELWEHNISVNELVPGPVVTDLSSEAARRQEGSVFTIDSEWIKRPEDVVPLALFLATQPDRGPTAQSFSMMRRDV